MVVLTTLHKRFCDEKQVTRGVSVHTIRWWRQAFELLCRTQNITELKDITSDKLLQFFVTGRQRGYRQGVWGDHCTLSYFKALNAFFNWCVKRKHTKKNPLAELDRPRTPARSDPKDISIEQAERLLQTALTIKYVHPLLNYRNHGLLSTWLLIGFRAGETLKLEKSHLDFQHDTIYVAEGKGRKKRIGKMNTRLKAVLANLLRMYDHFGLRSDFVFPSLWKAGHGTGLILNDAPQLTYNGLKRAMVRLRAKSGVNFTPHALRHSFATMLSHGGVEIKGISHALGHSRVQTTEGYVWNTASQLQEVVNQHPMNHPHPTPGFAGFHYPKTDTALPASLPSFPPGFPRDQLPSRMPY